MNHKNERIKKLWERGVRDPHKIAKKLGFVGVDRVLEGLTWLEDRGEIDKRGDDDVQV